MTVREIFVPATITDLTVIDPSEIRNIELTLPQEYEIDGKVYPVIDEMRPGTAFLAKPFGARTGRQRRRMYTRSNPSINAKGVLQTIINDTHAEKADTSVWWQTADVTAFQSAGETIPVLLNLTPDGTALAPYEHCSSIENSNLRLEPDDEWPTMRFLGIALSTGITPFLAHIRHMKALNFGRNSVCAGGYYRVVVSVKNHRQLMAHEELQEMVAEWPQNFAYHPVLTREWPDDWSHGTGRIMNIGEQQNGKQRISLEPLLEIVPNILNEHVRLCGSKEVCRQLTEGLAQAGLQPRSFRAEAW
ncbi:MAG: hypothetical protein CMH81_08045 [Nitrospiraceae bacterium]|nr:hypothetical protein [Nitrospiraceae bacterium]